ARGLQVVLPARRAHRPRGHDSGSGRPRARRPRRGALLGQRSRRRAGPRRARLVGVRGHSRRRAAAREVHPAGREHRDVPALPRLQRGPGPHPIHHEETQNLNSAAYNAWRITSLSTLPAWVIALALTVLAAAVWLSFKGFRSEPAGLRRRALLGFRLLAALLL